MAETGAGVEGEMAEAAEWAGRMGLEWARRVKALDRQLQPVADLALAALAPRPGERVIDLGCGAGATTQAIAAAVSPGGAVTAIDISPDLLAVARARCGMACVHFCEGDAARIALDPGHDALFSRFGCMFFDEPPAAFARLRAALSPEGRVLLAVWDAMHRNPWAAVPAEVGMRTLGPAEPKPATAPGPFAWADRDYALGILSAAGFVEVDQEEHEVELVIGDGDDADPVARAVAMLTRVGPLARRLKGLDHAVRTRVAGELAEALAPFVRDGWVRMPGAIRLIRARNPAQPR